MRLRSLSSIPALLLLLAPATAFSDPPAHAPAHGYRAKQKGATPVSTPESRGGIEVVLDPGRGIYVGVNLPNVFFHDGRYYREHEGHWQVSTTGRGDWRVSASSGVPAVLVKAKGNSHPGPAKAHKANRR